MPSKSAIAKLRRDALAVEGRTGIIPIGDSTCWRYRGSHGEAVTVALQPYIPNFGIGKAMGQLPLGQTAWANHGRSPFPGAVRRGYNAVTSVSPVSVPPTAYSAINAGYVGAFIPGIPFTTPVKLNGGIVAGAASATVVNTNSNAVSAAYVMIDPAVKKEICLATLSGTTLTLTSRGQLGTIAQAHNSGDEVVWIDWSPFNGNYFIPAATLGVALTNGVGATAITAATAGSFKNWKATGSVKLDVGQTVAYTSRTDDALTVSFTPNRDYAVGVNVGFTEFPAGTNLNLQINDTWPAHYNDAIKEVVWYEETNRGTRSTPSGAIVDRGVYNVNGDKPTDAIGSALLANASFEPVGSSATGTMKIAVRSVTAGERGSSTYQGIAAIHAQVGNYTAPIGPAMIHAQGFINKGIKFGHINGIGFGFSGRTAQDFALSLAAQPNRVAVLAKTCERIILSADSTDLGGPGYANAFLYVPLMFGPNDYSAVNGLAPFDATLMPWAVAHSTTLNGDWAGTDASNVVITAAYSGGPTAGHFQVPSTGQWVAYAGGGSATTLTGGFGGFCNTTSAAIASGTAIQFGYPVYSPTGFASSVMYIYHALCAAWDQACTNLGITANSSTRVFVDSVVPLRYHDTPTYVQTGSLGGLGTTEADFAERQGRLLLMRDAVLARRPNTNVGVIDLYAYGPTYAQISAAGMADSTAAGTGRLHHNTGAVIRAWGQALAIEFAGMRANSANILSVMARSLFGLEQL